MSDEKITSAGWDAITAEFERIYPDQKDPRHYGTLVSYAMGGNDPLDGISVYDGGGFWHFVSYGLSELYEKVSENKKYSGFGYELTFKLKKDDYENEENEIRCICGIMQAIARISFNSGDIFQNNEYIYTGQQTGIDARAKSNITGFICINDPSVNTLNTPNGIVEFIELIGMTDAELTRLKELRTHDAVAEMYKTLGSDITDYNRKSIV